MQNAPFITLAEDVRKMAEVLKQHSVIGIDTEFIRETTFFPKIALIQVATREQAWLLDPVALDAKDLEPFLAVLYDPQILKVMHAAFADQEVFYWAYGRIAEPVLDTAVAAALCGYGDNVGLAKLSKDVLRVQLHKGRARVKWLARPLSDELLHYAQQDVEFLVELSEKMGEWLKKKNRWEWALEESCVDTAGFDSSPEEIAHRLAKSSQMDETTYLALRELVRWREDRARKANMPRAWIAENEVLTALARSRPKSVAELRAFRGIGPKEVDRSGETILKAIAHALSLPKEQADLPVRHFVPLEVDSYALDLVKAYLAYLSARYEIAPRFLLRTGRAADLILYAKEGPKGWVSRGILSDAASRVIGTDLQNFLEGKILLGLNAGRVDIVRR
jgi:ribonuclease D